jgi:pilus assembly protein Flp/PilA
MILPAVPVHVLRRDTGLEPTRHMMDRAMIERLKTWPELKADRRALTTLEYALIAGVLTLAVLTASTILGNGIDNSFSGVAGTL